MRLSNIVTKKGDSGKTSIGSGERVSKDHPRVHAMGSVCLLYTSPSPRDKRQSRMPSSA